MPLRVRIGFIATGIALLVLAGVIGTNGLTGSPRPEVQATPGTGCLIIASTTSEARQCDTNSATPNLVNPSPAPASGDAGSVGISADTAVYLARSHVATDATFVSVAAQNLQGATSGASDRLIWAVTFTTEVVICPPIASPCLSPREAQTIVILDYYTGHFVESATYAPRTWPIRL